jgi:hypothetical protein
MQLPRKAILSVSIVITHRPLIAADCPAFSAPTTGRGERQIPGMEIVWFSAGNVSIGGLMVAIPAQPYPFAFAPEHCALVIIDMQRDFLEPGGFGDALGNDVGLLRRTIQPNIDLLKAARAAGMLVIHTREGHRPDVTDLPPAKKIRGNFPLQIGDKGPMGRILIRGEDGHDIIPELYPLEGEPVIDKPPISARSCATVASPSSSSPASPPKSASTRPCARPMIAASTASCSKIASAPISRNSTPSPSR